MNILKRKYNTWLLKRLIKYTGVDIRPEPGIWGLVNQKEEEEVLAEIYKNTQFISLLKKYAETANKCVLVSLNQIELGKFLALNGLILRSKRAYKKHELSTIKPIIKS